MTRVWDGAFDEVPLESIFSGTVSITPTAMCPTGDVACTADKSTHGYWNKDRDGLAKDERVFTLDEQNAFSGKKMYFWQVREYDPQNPPLKKVPDPTKPGKDKFIPSVFGSEWYGDNGKMQSDLKKGDRIYVRLSITNRHRLAYNLAVEDTKREIARLYAAAADVKVGSLSLQDVFKLDAASLAAKSINYTTLLPKM